MKSTTAIRRRSATCHRRRTACVGGATCFSQSPEISAASHSHCRQKRKSVSAVRRRRSRPGTKSQTIASCKRHEVGGRWEALQVNRHGEFLALRTFCLAKEGWYACLSVVCVSARSHFQWRAQRTKCSAATRRMDDVDAVICSKQKSAAI